MKVRYRFVAKTCDEQFHLFEMDSALPPMLMREGLLLVNVPDMPAPAGPDAEFANRVLRTVWDEAAQILYASVFPIRYPTETLDEVKEKLPAWEFVKTLQAGSVNDVGQGDLLNG